MDSDPPRKMYEIFKDWTSYDTKIHITFLVTEQVQLYTLEKLMNRTHAPRYAQVQCSVDATPARARAPRSSASTEVYAASLQRTRNICVWF
ncbi:hypothetical protein EVAR_97597_1 [Eumeta japonica]|uniref:Uncharacterized protein n=1 Tax=Eumeta variegata TaxID=151549 RepID=A0A4C1XKD9_EUMVA|nr:hypothetical protein EVAR_97597_1 [Eumeta japonica]